MDGKCRPAILAEESGDLVGDTLGAGEDQALVLVIGSIHDLLEMLDHLVTLLGLVNNLDNLGDTMVGRKLQRANVDLDHVGKEVAGKVADLLGPRCGPHERLAVRANLSNDLADLGLETHVQHAISLVQNEVCDATQVGLARLEHVDQTTRGGNADLDAAGQIPDLRALGDTAVDASVADAGRPAELGNLLLDLDSEFSGRGENKDDRAIAGSQKRLGVDVNDCGKTVSEGLSGARLGNANHITTRKCHGPSLGLDSSGSREALCLHLVDDVARESGLVESLDRLGNVPSVDAHSMVLAELLDLRWGTVGDVGMLLVEVLFELGQSREIPGLLLKTGTEVGHAIAAARTSESTTSVSAAAAAITTATGVAVGITRKEK